MRLPLLLLAACALAAAVSVKLTPHESRCFWTDTLEKGNVIASRFQVTEGGPNGIDMRILTPTGNIFFEVWNRLDGTYSFVVNDPGQYAVCFANSNFMMETEKRVSITLNEPENSGGSNLANEANLSPLEQAIVALSAEVASVQREQQYLKARERAHRETTESTNERVAYWSLAELCLLVLVSVWQIWMLKRSFEVVRSV